MNLIFVLAGISMEKNGKFVGNNYEAMIIKVCANWTSSSSTDNYRVDLLPKW